ncbi:hypothetical protein HOC80_03950 [archaeon]|jgi:hypothetical protein|nr:hypothetical protein [archaeon]MBT4417227.1 hypothetical protein [archaeon]
MLQPGTLRIKINLQVYEKTKKSWKKSKNTFPEAKKVIKLFKAHKNFDFLIDKKDSRFLKGQLSEGKEQGARINILPDGRKLDKAYSLFAKNLCVHDQTSNEHWDVIYQNKGGTYSYVYTLDKKAKAKDRKYKKVKAFEKVYPILKKKVTSALRNKEDYMALPMYTLLKTHIRVGNEIYYKAHKHKGLATLKKKDIKIVGNDVVFDFIGKDGVPINIRKTFPASYVKRLKACLKKCKDYVFVSDRGHVLNDHMFKLAFRNYCGKEFYPHIIRSYYATAKAKEFLKEHRKCTKDEMNLFFLSVAQGLGHKKFSKKSGLWEDSFTVTLNHYIEPNLVEKIKSKALNTK